jgi:hypothetical protein
MHGTSKMERKVTIPFSLYRKNLSRGISYPRDLTEFEARFANEPACLGLPVLTALARGFSLGPSSEE